MHKRPEMMRTPINAFQSVFDAARNVLALRLPDLSEPDRLELATAIALRARDVFDGVQEKPDGWSKGSDG